MKKIIKAKESQDGLICRYKENDKYVFKKIIYINYIIVETRGYYSIEEKLSPWVTKIEEIDNKHCKIFLSDNTQRNVVRMILYKNDIKTYEDDLTAIDRFLIEKKEKINSKDLSYLFYDIETDDREPLKKDVDGNIIAITPILSISYKDNNGYEFFLKNNNKENYLEGEKVLLEKHNEILKKYDIITGWNTFSFDDTYVKQRMFLHKISINSYDFINQVDYMLLFKKDTSINLASYSLNSVSNDIIGKSKINIEDEGEKGNGAIYNKWLKSFEGDETLEKYNRQDTNLVFLLDKKMKYIETLQNISDFSNLFIQDAYYNSKVWDIILLREYKKKGLISPSKKVSYEIEEQKALNYVGGGYTFCKKPGFHKNVFVYDFKSFYPTTISALNICNTTKLKEPNTNCVKIPIDIHKVNLDATKNMFLLNIKNNGISNNKNISVIEYNKKEAKLKFDVKYFDNTKRGILSDYMDYLIIERDKIKYIAQIEKDENKKKELLSKQNTYKVLANSGYGVMGLSSFRYFDVDVANAITQFCRYVIKKCVILAEENGFEVIQGDTDSIMIKNVENKITQKDLEEKFYYYFDEIAKDLNINSKKFELINPKTKEKKSKNHFIVFEYEKEFIKMLSIKKKNYAAMEIKFDKQGNQINEQFLSIVGLECIKKDTNPLGKELQKELIELIFEENEKKIDEYILKLYDLKDKLINNKIKEEYLIMSKTISKPLNEYGGIMIDSKTGMQKVTKTGKLMFIPIPAYITIAKKFEKEGKEVFVGQNIKYIVKTKKPKIEAISIEEYRNGEIFDREYYWERIITPVIKIFNVYNKNYLINNRNLWFIKEKTEKQFGAFLEKL